MFDAFLDHEAGRVARGDLAPVTLAAHRQLLDSVWRPAIGNVPLVTVRYSQLVKVADAHPHWNTVENLTQLDADTYVYRLHKSKTRQAGADEDPMRRSRSWALLRRHWPTGWKPQTSRPGRSFGACAARSSPSR